MVPHALYYFFFLPLLHIFPQAATAATEPAYTTTDFILLDCGASSNSNDTSGRNWDGDEGSRYAPSNAHNISSAFKASYMHPSVFTTPHETARVFPSPFTYTFPVSAGPKFLRLYFYPDTYSDFNTSTSYFSLTANGFTLLRNFSAFLFHGPEKSSSFVKEFVINMEENQRLALTFSPNPNSFAFINGIEIVSMPDTLYFRGNDVPIKFVNEVYYLQNGTALETLYRLNVGGSHVEIQNDSGPKRGMFRDWSPDDDYIFGTDYGYTPHKEGLPIMYTSETPPYSAPPIVYATARVTANFSTSLEWEFPVDSGFHYLLRLHFCEILQEITKPTERLFTIYINNEIAELEADVISWTVTNATPIFKDYLTWVADDGHRGQQDLRLSLKPNKEEDQKHEGASLNGLEIFKLSDPKQSLAAANPEIVMNSSPPTAAIELKRKSKSRGFSKIHAVIGSVIAVFVAVSFLILWRWRRRKTKGSATTSASWVLLPDTSRSTKASSGSGASLPSNICRYFSLDEIKTATCNFDDTFVIGEGGFGKVYKGLIDDATTTVAIKRLSQSSSQGFHEFLTEIKMLSKLRHLNLVSLIGYCDAYGEMILVYNYMAHGTLRSHLHNSQHPLLTWNQRLQICVAAAKGLHYLHTGAEQSIIHRDVKTSNILLDDKWVAKMSDFGLSKVGPTGGVHTHVSTVVKGSSGYVDPEYYRRRQLTEKSDVYSFGVVLFEVLCGRAAVIPSLPRGEANLAEWGQCCYQEGRIEQIVDANLNGQIAPECLNKFGETAAACVRGTGIERPAMNDVVWSLEFALQLQEAAESSRDGDCNSFITVSPSQGMELEMFSRSSEVPESKSSDIINPLARQDCTC